MNGRLSLSTAFDGQKTVTEDLYFAPPFKVYSPFYDHKGWAKYISMCGSAGVLAGDKNEIKLYSLGMTMDDIHFGLGKRTGVIAICEGGFAKACAKGLEEIPIDENEFYSI